MLRGSLLPAVSVTISSSTRTLSVETGIIHAFGLAELLP